MAKVTQGCFNMFTKVTPGIETETGTKLRPGIALPHAALPTTGKLPNLSRNNHTNLAYSFSVPFIAPMSEICKINLSAILYAEGGRIEIGAPSGRWQMIVSNLFLP